MKPLLTIGVTLSLAAPLSGCGGDRSESLLAPEAAGPTVVDADALLAGTWPADLQANGAELEGVLNGMAGFLRQD